MEYKDKILKFDNDYIMHLKIPLEACVKNYRKIGKNKMINLNTGEIIDCKKVYESKFDCIKNVRSSMCRFIKIALANVPQHIPNAFFATFTYQQANANIEQLKKDEKILIKRLRYIIPNFKYMLVREFQSRGSYHIHMIIWSDYKINIDSISSCWNNGIVNVQKITTTDSFENILFYLTNYNPKSKNEKVKHKIEMLKMFPACERMWSCSKGLLKPVEIDKFSEDKYINKKESLNNYGVTSTLKQKIYAEVADNEGEIKC